LAVAFGKGRWTTEEMRLINHYNMRFICKPIHAFLTRLFAVSFLLTTTMLKSASLAGEITDDYTPTKLYPALAQCVISPGNTTYYIDPTNGDDKKSGIKADEAWRTFIPINHRVLAPGDHVEIVAPGSFMETLKPMGAGTSESPVEIHFAKGRYDFFPTNAIKLKLNISNDNDTPDQPKAIALLFKNTRHFRVSGDAADFYIHGKMIEAMFDHADDMTLTGLSFDYHRPTVSEFTVLAVAADYADVRVNPDSTYAVENGKLVWIGEGWRSLGLSLTQECDPDDNGRTWRRPWKDRSPLADVTKVEELAPFQLRLFFNQNPDFKPGRVFQFREIIRDCVGVFTVRSQNIKWQHCAFYFLHGLGVVSQFGKNLTFDHVTIAPRPGSGRTCAGWADLMHFSCCGGFIKINDCKFAGMNDDAVNIHGINFRVVGRPKPDQLLLRFMHPQTYGFEAFLPGDDIELVNHLSLRDYHANQVTAVQAEGDKDILLTLARALPEKIGDSDVVENITWTPSVEICRCHVSMDSCRGFLVSTRRPVVIEDNTFIKTAMSAILVADDANSWFESGPVRDVIIRHNRFVKCAEPVITIAPENRTNHPEEPVHQNIRIMNNDFDLTGHRAIAARSVQNLLIQENWFSSEQLPVQTDACTKVEIVGNKLGD